ISKEVTMEKLFSTTLMIILLSQTSMCYAFEETIRSVCSRGKIPSFGIIPSAMSQDGNLDTGMDFRVRLLGQLSTKVNKKGDKITAEVISPQEFHSDIMEGVIKESKSGGSIKGTSILTFTFETSVHNDESTPIRSSIKSFINSKGQEMVDEEG